MSKANNRNLKGKLNGEQMTDSDLDEMRATNHQLKIENEELSQFAHILAHDLRAPIKNIHNLTKMLAIDDQSEFSSRANNWLIQIQTQADHLHKLIEDLRELSKQSLNSLSREPINLNVIVQNVLLLHVNDLEQQEVNIKIEPLPTVYANPQLIWQLFDNLIRNMLKHGTPPINAKITAIQSVGRTVICFANSVSSGTRISGDIFEFSSKASQHSTGIGLHICKKIADLHGGTISAEIADSQFQIYVTIEEKTHA